MSHMVGEELKAIFCSMPAGKETSCSISVSYGGDCYKKLWWKKNKTPNGKILLTLYSKILLYLKKAM